jgi:integrase
MRFLDEYIELFLSNKPNYANHVNALHTFLVDTKRNIKEALQGIRTETIIESLEYYIVNRRVTSRVTAQGYSFAIKDFFQFLFHNNLLENSEFESELLLPTYNEKSYRARMNKFIAEHLTLKDPEGFEIFNQQDIEHLIKDCDDTMNSEEIRDKAIKMQKFFNKFRSALIIKLILLCGMRYEVICRIKPEDLDLNHNNLVVNGIEISLTKKLNDQFACYEKIVEYLMSEIGRERKSLFVEFNLDNINEQTSTTSNFLKGLTGRGDLNGLIKYRVVQLIREGVYEKALKQLTSIGDKMFSECQSHAFDQRSLQRHLNSKIRNTELFDQL